MAHHPKDYLNFLKDNEYSISVLVPTRKRKDKLFNSIKSVLELADQPERLEIMVAIDNDDEETKAAIGDAIVPLIKSYGAGEHIIAFPRQGYAKLEVYYNQLAQWSRSDWLFMWGDDSVIKTQGWDTKIREHDGEFTVLRVNTHKQHPYSIFPIVPRDWYKLLGVLSNHQMGDAVISQMAYLIDIMQNVEIDVDHNRFDLLGEKPDEVYQQRQLFEGNPQDPRDLNHHANVMWRWNMCERLAWYLQQKGHDMTWWENIKNGTQDPWEKLKANDPNGQTCQNIVIRK